jgi:hypothetical protein
MNNSVPVFHLVTPVKKQTSQIREFLVGRDYTFMKSRDENKFREGNFYLY